MKRKPGEDFEEYRQRRRLANKALKRYLKGRWFWISAIIVPDAKNPKRFRKLRVRGTYRKEQAA
jgi:pyrroloquinoline quinone (PQQ) biosynthesis protein C